MRALAVALFVAFAAAVGGCLVDGAYQEYCDEHSGCTEPGSGSDAGHGDSGTQVDSGTPGDNDAGDQDSGTQGDTDAGAQDAGTQDAGTQDSGTPDSGTSLYPRWGQPAPLDVNYQVDVQTASLSPDGLTLCYGVFNSSQGPNSELYCVRRPTTSTQFDMLGAKETVSLNVYYNLQDVEVLGDTELFFTGAYGNITRATWALDGGWKEQPVSGWEPATNNPNMYPTELSFTSNGDLYFDYQSSTSNSVDIAKAVRTAPATFNAGTSPGSPLNTMLLESTPAVAPNEQFLLYKASLDGGYDGEWVVRPRPAESFSPLQPLDLPSAFKGSYAIRHLAVRPNGDLFVVTQDPVNQNWRYWIAPRLP